MPDIHPVTVDRYIHRTWRKSPNYLWTLKDVVCPVQISELGIAMMTFATAFVRSGDDVEMVALLGVGADKNLMLGRNGSWAAAYLPEWYKFHPFSLARNEQGDFVLMVDEASGLLDVAPDDNRFFHEDRTATEEARKMLDNLAAYERSRLTTRDMCRLLDKHALIKAWNIQVSVGGQLEQFNGLYCIDQAALNLLSPEALKELHDKGALVVAYAQLLSMQHLLSLSKNVEARIAAELAVMQEERNARPAQLDITETHGTFSFENL